MLSPSIIFWSAVAVLVFWALGAYNRLMGLRVSVAQALNTLAQQWQANATLLCNELASLSQTPETDSAWASLDSDEASWRTLGQATKQFQACLGNVQRSSSAVTSPDDAAAVRAAHAVMMGAWERLKNTHDDLAGQAVPQSLLVLWQQQQMQVSDKLRAYEASVQAYNLAVQQFPATLLAWIFDFRSAQALS